MTLKKCPGEISCTRERTRLWMLLHQLMNPHIYFAPHNGIIKKLHDQKNVTRPDNGILDFLHAERATKIASLHIFGTKVTTSGPATKWNSENFPPYLRQHQIVNAASIFLFHRVRVNEVAQILVHHLCNKGCERSLRRRREEANVRKSIDDNFSMLQFCSHFLTNSFKCHK